MSTDCDLFNARPLDRRPGRAWTRPAEGPILTAMVDDRPRPISPATPAACGSTRWSGCAGSPSPARRRRSRSSSSASASRSPFGLCFLVIAASAWVNLALRIRYPASHRLERQRRDPPARLRHPAARGAPLPDRRAAEPVRDAVPRAGADLGDRAAAGADARPRPARGRLGDAPRPRPPADCPGFPGETPRASRSST